MYYIIHWIFFNLTNCELQNNNFLNFYFQFVIRKRKNEENDGNDGYGIRNEDGRYGSDRNRRSFLVGGKSSHHIKGKKKYTYKSNSLEYDQIKSSPITMRKYRP